MTTRTWNDFTGEVLNTPNATYWDRESNANNHQVAVSTKFEVGKTYWTRSICDWDTIHAFEILARTAKTVTVKVDGKIVRRGLLNWNGVENFRPFGNYSMAAVISAAKVGAP